MKLKHNKKRNTAFLFESLVKETTKCIIKKNDARRAQIVSIIKEHFKRGTVLAKELELYQTVVEIEDTSTYTKETAEKTLQEAKRQYDKLDKQQIFQEQSYLIKKINKMLSKDVFANFVPNYKSLATVYQIFNQELSVKGRMLLESDVVERVTQGTKAINAKIPTDALLFKTFVEKFNDKYSDTLFEEQKNLLKNFVSSFSDNGVELKIFLNEELGRLKGKLKEAKQLSEIETNPAMLEKTEQVLQLVEAFKQDSINEKTVEKVLKIQNLVREIQNDGD